MVLPGGFESRAVPGNLFFDPLMDIDPKPPFFGLPGVESLPPFVSKRAVGRKKLRNNRRVMGWRAQLCAARCRVDQPIEPEPSLGPLAQPIVVGIWLLSQDSNLKPFG